MTLTRYRQIRDFRRTPEPAGTAGKRKVKDLHFVVQKHWAARLHYDFRLEHGGTLKSWAVPKGPPLNDGEKRLAVMVEDHPLGYRTFEGVIPEGNYGAGTVIIWDEGTYRVKDSRSAEESERKFEEGARAGHIELALSGKELGGWFSLVRMRGRGGRWLLIKHRGIPGEKEVREENPIVVNEEVGEEEAPPGLRELEKTIPGIDLGGAVRAPMPSAVAPMLATPVDRPFDRAGWIFEVKWDGYRMISSVHRGSVALYSRNNKLFNQRFPEIVRSFRKLPCEAIFDGEVVVLDGEGKADFPLLQNYLRTRRGRLVYYLFDILYLNGFDLRSLPLLRRREILRELLPSLDHVRTSDYVTEGGISFYRSAVESGIEGIMAKDGASPYRSGVRSGEWLKIKVCHRQEAVIGGYTAPRGSRGYFGALVLGVYDDGKLTWIGDAGGGFSGPELASLFRKFKPLVSGSSPFSSVPAPESGAVWLRPELVCEVEFSGWTRDGLMRQPVYLGLRDDRSPREVRREIPRALRQDPAGSGGTVEEETIGGVTVRLTNKDKVFWPDEGYTKNDLVSYYRDIAGVILPYLKDRPQSLNRHPDGIYGKSFIQKDVGGKVPAWVRTAPVYSPSDGRELEYLLCQDAATLLFMANLGCIEINPWHSRLPRLGKPDYLVLDFDPLGLPFARVVEAVLAARAVLEQAQAASFCKTSGATGMHVYVPLGGRYSYEQAEDFARVLMLLVNERLPHLTSVERDPLLRQGKVYLDYRQNAQAQTVACAYSLRPRRGAPVSAPLAWEEVGPGLDPSAFTLRTMARRLERKGDLWKGVLGRGIDMELSVEHLGAAYAR